MCFLWDSIFWANQESYERVMHLLYIWAQLLIKLSKQLHEKNILCQNLSYFILSFENWKYSLIELVNNFQNHIWLKTLYFPACRNHLLWYVSSISHSSQVYSSIPRVWQTSNPQVRFRSGRVPGPSLIVRILCSRTEKLCSGVAISSKPIPAQFWGWVSNPKMLFYSGVNSTLSARDSNA